MSGLFSVSEWVNEDDVGWHEYGEGHSEEDEVVAHEGIHGMD